MGPILSAFFTLLLIIVCVVMIFLVLLQRANTNAGLGTAFGGGMAESTFGADAGGVLKKLTFIAAVAFFILSFGLYLGYISGVGGPQVEEGVLPTNISAEEPLTALPEAAQEPVKEALSPILEPTVDSGSEAVPEEPEAGDSDADAPEQP